MRHTLTKLFQAFLTHRAKERGLYLFLLAHVLASVIGLVLFYATPMHKITEDFFYDVRTKLKPSWADTSKIVLVEIDDQTLQYFNGTNKDLNAAQLESILRKVMEAKPQEVAALYYSNIFEYSGTQHERLVEFVRQHKNITIATLGLFSDEPSLLNFPAGLQPIMNQVVSVDTFRSRSNSIVRNLVFKSYRGLEAVPNLPLHLAEKLAPQLNLNTTNMHFRLNYRPPETFTRLNAVEIFKPDFDKNYLKNKIVIVGYSIYRDWHGQTIDPLLANTPLQHKENTFMGGSPLIYIAATGIENIINNTWIKPAPSWIGVLQTLLICILLFIAWYTSSLWGSLATVILGLTTLWVHAGVMEKYSVMLPFAETFFFGSLTIVLGCFISLQKEIKQLALSRTQLVRSRVLENLQSKFLDDFSSEVIATNENIRQTISEIDVAEADATDQKLLINLRDSCLEFKDFLEGIRQLATAGERVNSLRRDLKEFNPYQCIEKIFSRFQHVTESRKVSLINSIPRDFIIRSNPEIIDTIMYNFIGNAVKYSPDGATVTVECTISKAAVRFSVNDNGPGIKEEYQKLVFEKFYRVKDDSVYKIKGTGIGLYLAKFFANKIGGKVYLTSKFGVGSTFFLEVKRR